MPPLTSPEKAGIIAGGIALIALLAKKGDGTGSFAPGSNPALFKTVELYRAAWNQDFPVGNLFLFPNTNSTMQETASVFDATLGMNFVRNKVSKIGMRVNLSDTLGGTDSFAFLPIFSPNNGLDQWTAFIGPTLIFDSTTGPFMDTGLIDVGSLGVNLDIGCAISFLNFIDNGGGAPAAGHLQIYATEL